VEVGQEDRELKEHLELIEARALFKILIVVLVGIAANRDRCGRARGSLLTFILYPLPGQGGEFQEWPARSMARPLCPLVTPNG
jgi:hypothetical protein